MAPWVHGIMVGALYSTRYTAWHVVLYVGTWRMARYTVYTWLCRSRPHGRKPIPSPSKTARKKKNSAPSTPHLEARPVVHPEHTLHQVTQRVVPQIAAHVPDPSHDQKLRHWRRVGGKGGRR